MNSSGIGFSGSGVEVGAVGEAVTPSGVTEDIVLQKMHLPKASVVSPNQKQTYISTPYSKINRKL